MESYQSKYTGAEIDGQLDKVTSLETEMSKKVNKTTTINGKALSSNITLTKGDIGLGNVDNTSDLNKPISTATQTAIDEETTARELGTNEYNVSILHPTSGVTSSGASGGNLYSLETASAIVGTDIKKGQVLAFYDKDNNGTTAKYEYNGTDWDELWLKKSKYIDGSYIKEELINPLYGKAKGVITRASNSNILTTSSYYILPNSIYVDRINAKLPFTVQLFVKGIDYNTEWTENFYAIGVNNDFGSGSIGYRTYNSPKIPNVDKTLKHYIIAFDGELCRAYVNGVACEEFNPKFKINQDKLAAYLGVGSHGSSSIVSTKNMRIQYNLLRFFNYALSADEAKALYNNGKPDKYTLPNSYKNIDTESENGCIGEYIPSSLISYLWRDTSGQGNDLNATGTPELIYNNPYSEILSGEGAPSIIPNFIGQAYYDLTNNKKYEAFGTTAASDWKPLN